MRRLTREGTRSLETFNEAWLHDLYDGVSVRYYVDARGRLKYDILLDAGADPSVIRFRYDGAEGVDIRDGMLHVRTSVGTLSEESPWCYQEIAGVRRSVDCRFIVRNASVRFDVGDYDSRLPLVIDPAILLSTYLGGSLLDGANGVDRDAQGNLYVVGTTRATDFPTTTGAYRRTPGGPGSSDIFVACLNPTGNVLLSATYIGGSGNDEGWGIRATAAGRVVVAGTTGSTDFPVTAGVPQPISGGGVDGVVVVLNGSLSSLVASTYCGGSGEDRITDLSLGPGDHPYVVGWTSSSNFPRTPGVYRPPGGGGEEAFAVRYTARLDTLGFSMVIGGGGSDRGTAVSVESGGGAWITGWSRSGDFPTTDSAFNRAPVGGRDAFVIRLRFNGTALEYGTFLGGSGDDEGSDIAVDSGGGVLVTGRTASNDFPLRPATMTSPVGSWFAARILWPSTPTLGYSRYLGVVDQGSGRTIAVDGSGVAYIGGTTSSPSFPLTQDGSASPGRGGLDLAFVRLSPNGDSILHASVVGGLRADSMSGASHLTRLGDLIVAGATSSPNFPVGRAAYDSIFNDGIGSFPDGFVLQYSFASRPSITAPARIRFDTLRCDTVAFDTVWVYSVGQRPLIINDFFLRLGSSRFVVTRPIRGQLPLTLQPGDSTSFVIRFASSGQGIYRDTLVIASNDSLVGRQQLSIALEGIRAVPGLGALPREVRFAATLVCAPIGVDSAVVITNDGEGPLRVLDVSLVQGIHFSLGALPLLPRVLLEREGFNAPIRFRPTAFGRHRDTIVIRFAECALPLRVPLEGFGDTLALLFADTAMTVPELPWCVTSFDTTVRIVNNGTRTTRIVSALFVGTGFSLIDTLPRSVPPSGTMDLRLRVSIPVGADTARLIVRGDTCGVVASVWITASRRARDTLVSDISILDFGTGAGCSGDTLHLDSVVILRNTTSRAILVPPPLVSAPFAFRGAPTFPVVLATGDSIIVPLGYSPIAEAFHQGTLFVPFESGGCYDTLRITLFGGRYDERMELGSDTIDFPDLAQCQESVDTIIVLRNTSSLPMTINAIRSQGGGFGLRPLPFTIGPLGADTITIRYTPRQAGLSQEILAFRVGKCDLELPLLLRGRKDGVVLSVPGGPARFPTVLECEIPTVVTTTIDIQNVGNVAIDARIVGARVVGDPSITVDPAVVGMSIPVGETRGVEVRFAAAGPGAYVGVVELVIDPCGDTIRVPVDANVEPVRVAVNSTGFGPVPVGSSRLLPFSLRNDNARTIVIERIDSIASPFRVTSTLPLLPATLAPGDSIELTIEFAPDLVGQYSHILFGIGASPCVFTIPISLTGEGTGEGDTVRFCLVGGGTGLVGDTVDAVISLLSPPLSLPGIPDLQYRVTYDFSRLQPIDVASDVAPVFILPASTPGDLVIEQKAVPTLVSNQVRVRFRLLAGRHNPVRASLTEVAFIENGFTPRLCGDTVVWRIVDRCVVTGLALGRFSNALEPPNPNPASGSVGIIYGQLEDARAVVRIVDLAGRELLRPLDAELPGGRYALRVDISDLSSGLYFIVLDVGIYRASRAMMVQD